MWNQTNLTALDTILSSSSSIETVSSSSSSVYFDRFASSEPTSVLSYKSTETRTPQSVTIESSYLATETVSTLASTIAPCSATIFADSASSIFSNCTTHYHNDSFTNTTTVSPSRRSVNGPLNSEEIALLFAFTLILIIGTLGNGYIYYYFGIRKKSKRTIPEMLFSYLAIFDFTASVLNPILYINFTVNRNKWLYGVFLCKTSLTLGAAVTTVSGGIFIIIAFDRERCIVFPFKSHFKPKTIKICVFCSIVYAVFMNFHYALHLTVMPETQRCTVSDVTNISYWLPTIICFVIQDLTLIFVFAFTNMRIFDHIKAKDTTLALGAFLGKRKKDSAKIIRLLVVLATVFFVLTLPRDLFITSHMMSWVFSPPGIDVTPTVNNVYYFIKVLHIANSSVNIFIYYYMHRGFRRHMNHHLLCCIFGPPPKVKAHFLDTITRSTEGSPNLIQKHLSPLLLRSPSRSPHTKRSRNAINERMIDESNIGRKRTVRDMAASPKSEMKQLLNIPDNNLLSASSDSDISI